MGNNEVRLDTVFQKYFQSREYEEESAGLRMSICASATGASNALVIIHSFHPRS